MDSLSLRGASEDGWRFASERFHVMHFSHPPGDELDYQGICSDAEIARDIDRADHPDMPAWFVRKLGTFHGMERQTALGRLVITGRAEGAESQRPACVLAIHADGQELDGWWEESERLLVHLERVLSFACDSYLVPVYEQGVRGDEMVLRVVRRGTEPRARAGPRLVIAVVTLFG